jgi:hypothetical protein
MARITKRKTTNFYFSKKIPKMPYLLVFLGVFAVISCGRKGPPKPPEDFAPSPVLNLNVEGTVSGVSLTWEAPPVDPDKDEEDLKDLRGFIVQRSPYTKENDAEFDQLGSMQVTDPTQTKFSFVDKSPEPGKIYNYQVLPYNVDRVNGEPGQTLRVTFLGESSRVERIILETARIQRTKAE